MADFWMDRRCPGREENCSASTMDHFRNYLVRGGDSTVNLKVNRLLDVFIGELRRRCQLHPRIIRRELKDVDMPEPLLYLPQHRHKRLSIINVSPKCGGFDALVS